MTSWAFRRPVALVTAVVLGLGVAVTQQAGPASADVQRLETQLAIAQRQLNDLQVESAQAAEAVDIAAVRLATAERNAIRAAEENERATVAARALQDDVALRASAVYRSVGPMDAWSTMLSAPGRSDVAGGGVAQSRDGDSPETSMARAAAAESAAQDAQQQADEALRVALFASHTLAAEKVAVEDRVAAAQDRVNQLTRDRSALVAEEAERSRQRVGATVSGSDPDGGSLVSGAPGAAAAVAFAITQIGKPYRWAAAGPGAYDCSGLTMRAWERGGVVLVHHSAEQFNQAQPVPFSSLSPGDLVFYAVDPYDPASIYHVGLYVGSEAMVEAPHPGANVRLASIWRAGLYGFGRPRSTVR